jgi:EpsI family protein
MKECNKLSFRPVTTASLIAIVMMFAFGAANRTLTNRLANSQSVSPIPSDALDGLSLQISDWTGQDEPLDEAIIEATDTDAHISRLYRRHSLESVWLYIAAGRRTRDLMPHRPEVCYTGAGWTRISSKSKELIMDDKTLLPCSIFQFSRGALNTKNVIILDYYIVDGQFSRDVSLLRSKIWKGDGMVKYSAQIEIVASVTTEQSAETAEKLVLDFAFESAQSILKTLQRVVDSQYPNTEQLMADVNSGDSGGE